MKSFGTLIREARLTKGPTLRDAAKRLCVSPTYLSQIENDKVVPPSPEVLRRIEALYGIPFELLLQHAKNRIPESVGQDAANDRVVAALLRKVLDLDAPIRAAALREVLKSHAKLTDEAIDALIKKMTTDLKRLDRGREGLFAADVEPRRLSKRWIEGLAESFLAERGVDVMAYRPPTNVESLIERHPDLVLVVDEALDSRPHGEPQILGLTHWDPDERRRVIKVNPKLINDPDDIAEHRYRFTLGHELFHAIEHLPRMDTRFQKKGACLREIALVDAGVVASNSDLGRDLEGPTWWLRQRLGARPLTSNEDWREWQANVFSSSLLMPERPVRKEFELRFGTTPIAADPDPRRAAWMCAASDLCPNGCFDSLYKTFAVSRQAMAVRLLSLGLVTAG